MGCSFGARDKPALAAHMREHGERPWKCAVSACGFSGVSAAALRMHANSKHSHANEESAALAAAVAAADSEGGRAAHAVASAAVAAAMAATLGAPPFASVGESLFGASASSAPSAQSSLARVPPTALDAGLFHFGVTSTTSDSVAMAAAAVAAAAQSQMKKRKRGVAAARIRSDEEAEGIEDAASYEGGAVHAARAALNHSYGAGYV